MHCTPCHASIDRINPTTNVIHSSQSGGFADPFVELPVLHLAVFRAVDDPLAPGTLLQPHPVDRITTIAPVSASLPLSRHLPVPGSPFTAVVALLLGRCLCSVRLRGGGGVQLLQCVADVPPPPGLWRVLEHALVVALVEALAAEVHLVVEGAADETVAPDVLRRDARRPCVDGEVLDAADVVDVRVDADVPIGLHRQGQRDDLVVAGCLHQPIHHLRVSQTSRR
mmetsp:Transcript_30465/g.88554  ORF Transcript_30465/g.88554 Transcript_30465/m.88554 type:complete len:225 (-) Transcript_30465:390-1064(-)